MKSAQQINIEVELSQLVKNNKKGLIIKFVDLIQEGITREPCLTSCQKRGYDVYLTLVEPPEGDYCYWKEAIDDAKLKLEMVKKEKKYAEEHPNFFNSIRAKIQNIIFSELESFF